MSGNDARERNGDVSRKALLAPVYRAGSALPFCLGKGAADYPALASWNLLAKPMQAGGVLEAERAPASVTQIAHHRFLQQRLLELRQAHLDIGGVRIGRRIEDVRDQAYSSSIAELFPQALLEEATGPGFDQFA